MPFSQIATSVTIINSGLIGYFGTSLTDFSLSSASLIASGSAIEIGGSFFVSSEDITPNASSWAAISNGTTAYLLLTPSGVAGSQILSAAWQSSAPVWSTSKQGWYASAASISRVVARAYKNSNTSYSSKNMMNHTPNDLVNREELTTIINATLPVVNSPNFEVGAHVMATFVGATGTLPTFNQTVTPRYVTAEASTLASGIFLYADAAFTNLPGTWVVRQNAVYAASTGSGSIWMILIVRTA